MGGKKIALTQTHTKKQDVSFAFCFRFPCVDSMNPGWGAERKIVRHLVTSVLYM